MVSIKSIETSSKNKLIGLDFGFEKLDLINQYAESSSICLIVVSNNLLINNQSLCDIVILFGY